MTERPTLDSPVPDGGGGRAVLLKLGSVDPKLEPCAVAESSGRREMRLDPDARVRTRAIALLGLYTVAANMGLPGPEGTGR